MPAGIAQASSGALVLFIAFIAQALKEMGIPSPGLSQSLLLYAGYQLSFGSPYLGTEIILSTFLGSLSGACLIFFLARWKGEVFLAWLDRHALIKAGAVVKVRSILTTSSFMTISIGRSIPGLMLPTSILAGIMNMPLPGFLGGIVLALSVWVIAFVAVGTTLKHLAPQIHLSSNTLVLPLAALLVSGVLAGFITMWRRYKKIHRSDIQGKI